MSDSKTVKVVNPSLATDKNSAASATAGRRIITPVTGAKHTPKKREYVTTQYQITPQGQVTRIHGQGRQSIKRPAMVLKGLRLKNSAPAIISKEAERAIVGVGEQIEANMARNTAKMDELLSVLKSANQKLRRHIVDINNDF